MSSFFPILCSLPVLALVVGSIVVMVRWRRVRLAERIPIAEAAHRRGYCEVEGTVQPRAVFHHPAVEGPVVWARLHVMLELDPASARRGEREPHVMDRVGDVLWVTDESGQARIDPRGAIVEIGEPEHLDYTRADGVDPPEWLRELVRGRRQSIEPSAIRRATGSAEVIRPGQPLYVLGYAEPEQSGEAMYRDAKLVASFRQRRGRKLMIANMPERELQTRDLGFAAGLLVFAALIGLAWYALFG